MPCPTGKLPTTAHSACVYSFLRSWRVSCVLAAASLKTGLSQLGRGVYHSQKLLSCPILFPPNVFHIFLLIGLNQTPFWGLWRAV